MIKPELIELIEYLESEKKNLENQKSDCLREWDYEGAHYFSIAIGEINRQLRILYNFNGPFYDEKKRLENYKLLFDTDVKDIDNERLKQVYAERRKEIDEQINQLKKRIPDQKLDGQEFDDAIYDLIEKRINGFKFNLRKEDNLYLDFFLIDDKALLIATSLLNTPEDKYEALELMQKLPSLGFTYNENNKRMEYSYNLSKFKNSFEIKILISRIIFDILYYKELDNPAFIEKY